MDKKMFWRLALGGLMVAGLLTGCSKSQPSAGAFDAAAPEIRQAWEAVSAADKANDYATAIDGYHKLLTQQDKLTEAQGEVLKAASLALNQRFTEAVNAGDPAAKAVADAMGKAMKGR